MNCCLGWKHRALRTSCETAGCFHLCVMWKEAGSNRRSFKTIKTSSLIPARLISPSASLKHSIFSTQYLNWRAEQILL